MYNQSDFNYTDNTNEVSGEKPLRPRARMFEVFFVIASL